MSKIHRPLHEDDFLLSNGRNWFQIPHGARIVSIAITPNNPSVVHNGTQQFAAIATYSDTSTRDITATATWDGPGTNNGFVAGQGLYTAPGGGSDYHDTVRANQDGITGSGPVTVPLATLTSLTVSPSSVTLLHGATQTFSAVGNFSDDSTSSGASIGGLSWSAVYGSAVVNDGGTATYTAPAGTGAVNDTVTATVLAIGGGSGTASVTVNAVPIPWTHYNPITTTNTNTQVFALSNDNAFAMMTKYGNTPLAAKWNGTSWAASAFNFQAAGIGQNPSTNMDHAGGWVVPDGSAAFVWGFNRDTGSYVIWRSTDFVTFTDVTGNFPSLNSYLPPVLWGANGNDLWFGTTSTFFHATAGYTGGWTSVLTSVDTSAIWGTATSDIYLASYNQYQIAHWNGTALTVRSTPTAPVNGTAVGTETYYLDGSGLIHLSTNAGVSWTTCNLNGFNAFNGIFMAGSILSDPTKILVTGASNGMGLGIARRTSQGVFNTENLGTTGTTGTSAWITPLDRAFVGGANGEIAIKDLDGAIPTLSSIAVTPATVTLAHTATQQYAANGTYSNGAVLNLTSQVTWSATNGSVDANGLYTAPGGRPAGTDTVTATLRGHSGTSAVTITAAPSYPSWTNSVPVTTTSSMFVSAVSDTAAFAIGAKYGSVPFGRIWNGTTWAASSFNFNGSSNLDHVGSFTIIGNPTVYFWGLNRDTGNYVVWDTEDYVSFHDYTTSFPAITNGFTMWFKFTDYGVNPNELWCGTGGTFYRFNTTTDLWESKLTGVDSTKVTGSNYNDVYLVSKTQSQIVHWDGTSLTTHSLATAPADAFAIANELYVLSDTDCKYSTNKGVSWASCNLNGFQPYNAHFMSGDVLSDPTRLFLVGASNGSGAGVARRTSAGVFTTETMVVGSTGVSAFVTQSGRAFVGADNGNLFVKDL